MFKLCHYIVRILLVTLMDSGFVGVSIVTSIVYTKHCESHHE